ncbi:ABC transporter permease [Spiroplasma endosymbiont of Virgichneumon dumeticola]|uniref:ABC transporter permease n=1 Tax=Spiroplasma endosymbiont of Virgichneumon dumeticola TaxID=3139323 RepID=UPI0035C90B8B
MPRLKKRSSKVELKTTVSSKNKKRIFRGDTLLLKQTLIATWKSKLQLVILLLLTAFATSLVTGCWISYDRMIDGSKEMGLDDLKFDAVLPYSPVPQGIKQIADQAFSLKLGRLYYQETGKSTSKALYFDNTVIGSNQQINAITVNDVIVDFNHDVTGKITGLNNFNWANPTNPLTFNLNNSEVKASIYGQLQVKAVAATTLSLKNHYLQAASDLYRDIFMRLSVPNITTAVSDFIKSWIVQNSTSPELSKPDSEFIEWILENKVNFQSDTLDSTIIPDATNLFDDNARNSLFTTIKQGIGSNKSDFDNNTDPRAATTATFGMNGHYMRIGRTFDNVATSDIYSNLHNYFSPAGFNQIGDGRETDAYSFYLARAAASLQERDIYVRNQFNAIVKTENTVQTNTKVIDIGMPGAINHANLKIFEGVAPTSRNEIAITPQYARKLHYKPGDSIVINNSSFIITGIGGDAYDIYPTINDLDPVPNTRTEFIAYAPPIAWSNSDWYPSKEKTDTTLMYFTPWNDRDNKSLFNTDYFDDFFQKTIFSDNGNSEHNQFDYNKYLIEKYTAGKSPTTIYHIVPNLVIASDNSQFSIYSGRKQIFESSVKGFLYASIIAVLFLVSIVIFITTLIVKKAIQHGQVSMGILKSIGYKTWQITLSYLSYPLIALAIAIPVGWIAGLVVQVYLTEIFNTLFVLPYNVFNFNVAPLFASIALIIGFIAIATVLTAFRVLKKDPLLLIKKDSDLALSNNTKKKASGFLKNHFRWRFLLSLSKTSWKKILVTSSVISLATLSIVATTAIPATIFSLKTSYFKTQKYKNYYEYQTPIPNLPVSKYGLYAWNFFDKPQDEQYYPVYGAMPWPEDKIIYDSNDGSRVGWYDPLSFKANDPNQDFVHIFNFDPNYNKDKNVFTTAMTNYYNGLANGTLSINDLAWSYSWLGGKAFSNELLTELSKRDQTPGSTFSSSLVNFASTALPTIIGVSNPGVAPGPDAIKEILKQTLPGYVCQSLDSLPKIGNQDPYDYFSIGHNTVAFNPNHSKEKNGPDGPSEELVTQFKIGSNNSDLASKGLMDTIGINPDTKMIVLKNNEANLLHYSSTATVIPMVINKAFQSKYGLSVGSTFDGAPDINTLCYKNENGKMIPLPKDSWYYGDNPENAPDNGGIWSKNGTKWNYRENEQIGNTGYTDIQGYEYGGMYGSNGKPIIDENNPKAWNDMNKVWLKVPDKIDKGALKGTIRKADGSTLFPFDINSIAKTKDSKWIKPFSFSLSNSPTPEPSKPIDPVGLLTNRNPEWFIGMIDRGILEKQNTLSGKGNLQQAIKDMPLWWQNIIGDANPIHSYQIVGIQDSYDTPKAYIDQKWANQIVGYSAYDDNPYYDGTTVPQWFSGKLSADNNIFDLIGRMSFKQNVDDYSIYGTVGLNNNGIVPLVANNDLLSRKQAMLNKMSDISFSASALFIVTTIICSILIVIMITDLFTDQFRLFMAHMKAEGYTNSEINSFILGIFTPWALLGYLAGFAIGFLVVYGLITTITAATALALPFTITWWILPVSFVVIGGIYISTFIINNSELNKMNLIELLKSDE